MRTLGRSRVSVTALGLGGAPLGNLSEAVDEDTAAGAVRAAWEAGLRLFDTAPHYGLGLSERRLGRVLADLPREGYTLSTKVGRILEPTPERARERDDQGFDVPAAHTRRWDFSADGVRRSLEGSLERLGLDRVDLLLIHDPDDHGRQALEEAYPALHELRSQGVVGAIGAGMNQAAMLERFATETDVDALLLAGRHTLIEQADSLLAACLERGVSVLAGGVFNSGLLAHDHPPPEATYDYRRAPAGVRERALRIAATARRHGVSLPQAAIAFTASHPAVASVVLGMRTAEQVRRNAALAARAVPAALWSELVEEGLLDPGAVPHNHESTS
ncbi:D-threo-aldose 1-dehydrogenase [Nocardiopsis sp. Huas11]|uniref:aldo/keto reductase n=1 Tax=Nocardiopsis sp. Huas11 TaxID=2183912 RepID=UPI000EAC80EF|nr:aldo/keto reductase [Nocardiopsis sp. Huas11]RKS09705.1 D-threo-aldose 1-dehydrogenase [Nocardiopsis sp. Huas11]